MTLKLDRSVRAVIHDLLNAAPPISDSPTPTITTETGSARPRRRPFLAVAAAAIAVAGIGAVLAVGTERTPSQPRATSPGGQEGPIPIGSTAPTPTSQPQAGTSCATNPTEVTLPNFAGQSYADAEASLLQLGLQPTPLFENTPRGVASAIDPVVRQLLPGVIVSCGTQIELVVAFDPGPLHIVQPGDTFASIASATGISVDDLIAYNGIENDAELRAGLAIRLSAPEGPPPT